MTLYRNRMQNLQAGEAALPHEVSWYVWSTAVHFGRNQSGLTGVSGI